MFANTQNPPYYAVIFVSQRKEGDKEDNGYTEMAQRMTDLAINSEGFIGIDSVRGSKSITVTYWRDMESIKKWRENSDHMMAREVGYSQWYKNVVTRIALVERDYTFDF